jgi:hypothetical protein
MTSISGIDYGSIVPKFKLPKQFKWPSSVRVEEEYPEVYMLIPGYRQTAGCDFQTRCSIFLYGKHLIMKKFEGQGLLSL